MTPLDEDDYIPDDRLLAAGERVLSQLRDGAAAIDADPARTSEWLDDAAAAVIGMACRAAGADDGSVWLADSSAEALVAVFSLRGEAGGLLGFRQPLSEGLVSMVFATEQPICLGGVRGDPRHSGKADSRLGQETCAMIAVPLAFAGEVRGVISCVRLAGLPGGRRGDFSADDLGFLRTAANAARRLIDFRFITKPLGIAP